VDPDSTTLPLANMQATQSQQQALSQQQAQTQQQQQQQQNILHGGQPGGGSTQVQPYALPPALTREQVQAMVQVCLTRTFLAC